MVPPLPSGSHHRPPGPAVVRGSGGWPPLDLRTGSAGPLRHCLSGRFADPL